MDGLTFNILGPFFAELDSQPLLKFRTNRVQALLVYLATEAALGTTTHRREGLLDLFWPGMTEEAAFRNLRQTIYQLRQAIPAEPRPFLLADRKTVGLNPDFPLTFDVARFRNLLRGQPAQWAAAVALYRGDFLSDFSLPDADPFEHWTRIRRAAFRQQALDALASLADHYSDHGFPDKALPFARRQIELDDLREEGYRQLMGALAASGRKNEALTIYGELHDHLEKELGVTPDPETTALHDAIYSDQHRGGSRSNGRLRSFELQEQIGAGSFGAVYRAVQPAVGREVAVKIILPKFANDPDFIRQFEAEAQHVARLEHPHIVPLYDYWREPNNAYLVMRLLKGGSLQGALPAGGLEVERVVRLVDQIAAALDVAHQRGVVHRDIKPGNILLDEEGNGYLSDFGIARDLSDPLTGPLDGRIMSSMSSISPEQIRREPLTAASDIYSLGVLLFNLLTGRPPFETDSVAELVYKHAHDLLPSVRESRPELPAAIDDVIQRATAKIPEQRYPSALALVDDLHRSFQNSSVIDVAPAPKREIDILNPYKGLAAFSTDDAALFFGREALTGRLIDRLASGDRFVAVVGPSGSGKSSVVRAGLIPALRQSAFEGSSDWFVSDMIPGAHPFEELELALQRVAVRHYPSLLNEMRAEPRGILQVVRRILPDDRTPLLMIIDQFEELFTLADDPDKTARFLKGLQIALEDNHSPLRLVLTMRADFYDRVLLVPGFSELVRDHTEVIIPMTADELAVAIRRPAELTGVAVEPDLVTQLVADVTAQPGSLPLLQYTLSELYERRADGPLTAPLYRDFGGLSEAIGRRAEEIYQALDDDGQAAARQLFLRLVTLGEGVEDTRRRVRRSELEALDPNQPHLANSKWQIANSKSPLGAFGAARLLSFDRDPLNREPTVEVAHEALLREWPRLRRWLDDGRDDVRRQRELAAAGAQWEKNKRDDSYLLRGGRLATFENWAEDAGVALTAGERAFLDRSLQFRDEQKTAEAARQAQELETARRLADEQEKRAEEQEKRAEEQEVAAGRLRQRARILGAVGAVALLLAVVAFGFFRSSSANADLAATRAAEAQGNLVLAVTNEAEAVRNANVASIREAEAQTERAAAVEAQALTAAESIIRATAEAVANQERGRAEEQQMIAEEQLALTTSRELALAANANLQNNPERSLLLGLEALEAAYTTEAEGALRAALQESRVELTLVGEKQPVVGVDYHPGGEWLAGIGDEGELTTWDAVSGETRSTVSLGEGTYTALTVSPSGERMAIARQNLILLLDGDSLEVVHELQGHLAGVLAIDFSSDGTLLASGDENGVVKIWLVGAGAEQLTFKGSDRGWVNDVSFSPDGSRLATAGDDLTARIWDLATGEELVRMIHGPRANFVLHVQFNGDGTRLFTSPAAIASNIARHTISVWDVGTISNREISQPAAEWIGSHSNLLYKISLSPDGRYLATASQDSTVIIWDATNDDGHELMTLAGHEAAVIDSAFSPDSQHLVTTSSISGVVRTWNIEPAGFGEIVNIETAMRPVSFSPNNGFLVSGISDDPFIRIWDVASGTLAQSFDSQMMPSGAELSPDGRFLAVIGTVIETGAEDIVNIWDMTTFELVSTFQGHEPGAVGFNSTGIQGLDFSPDGSILASAGADGFVIVWDVKTGDRIYEWRVDPRNSIQSGFEGSPNGATNVRFSPDGRLIAASTDVADDGSIIKVWNVATGEEGAVLEGFPTLMWGLAFSPNSQQIVGTGAFGTIMMWDPMSGELVADLKGSTTTNTSVLFMADGKQLITGRSEIVLWDLETQEPLLKFPVGTGALILSADGHYLAARGEGVIHIFTLNFDELVEIARSRVSRKLTDAECKEYLHLKECPDNG